MSQDNPWSGSVADRRIARGTTAAATSAGFAAASATTAADPWLATTSAAIALVVDNNATVPHTARIRLIARDGFSQASTSNGVIIRASSATIVLTSFTVTAGTPLSVLGTNTGIVGARFGEIVVMPDATGLVDLRVLFAAAAADAVFSIEHRSIIIGGAVAVG